MRKTQLSWLPLGLISLLFSALPVMADGTGALDNELLKRTTGRTEGGIDVPILRRQKSKLQRRDGQAVSVGIGDYQDVTYNVLLTVGEAETPLVVDTGSSDLWVISDSCTGNCTSSVPLYPHSTFKSANLDVQLLYGDSFTGTHAYGLIGQDTVGLGDIELQGQYFAAINNTNTTVLSTGSAGIFGLGFPINSVIWMKVFQKQSASNPPTKRQLDAVHQPHQDLLSRAIHNFVIRFFPKSDFHGLSSTSLPSLAPRQSSSSLVSTILSSYSSIGPFISRLVAQGTLTYPMFTITLQRDSVDIGGNIGIMSLGKLPAGVNNDSLTWVKVRGYTTAEGGMTAPPDSPGEVYPVAWEVPIDDVWLDGQVLPRSSLSAANISLSALIDTGNSLIRGPTDVVKSIQRALGPSGHFSCSQPHNLAFQIGGQMFPIDPRDFVNQVFQDSLDLCLANIAGTDAPSSTGNGYLYSWSLGDPFLKSVMASFYYGNLSYPSHDPPRIGFLSTVPADAGDQLKSAVVEASATGGNFLTTSDSAPSGTLMATFTGIPQASSTSAKHSGAYPTVHIFGLPAILLFLFVTAVLAWT